MRIRLKKNLQRQNRHCIFFREIFDLSSEVIKNMLNSKSYPTWIAIFILSLFIASCGGGTGSSGSGGGATPTPIDNGNGNDPNTMMPDPDPDPRGLNVEFERQIVALNRQVEDLMSEIRTLEATRDANQETIRRLRSQIADLMSRIEMLTAGFDPTEIGDRTSLLESNTFKSSTDSGSVVRFREANGNTSYVILYDDDSIENALAKYSGIEVQSHLNLANKGNIEFKDNINFLAGYLDDANGARITNNENEDFAIEKFVISKNGLNIDMELIGVSNSSNSFTSDWNIRVNGPNLLNLPSGNQTYTGYTITWDRSENGAPRFPKIPIRRFDMSVNFTNGTGNISQDEYNDELHVLFGNQIGSDRRFPVDPIPVSDSTPFDPVNFTDNYLHQYYLTGDFSVDMVTGTFTGNSLDLKNASDTTDNSKATLYGTFHGAEAFGVSGVFHENDDSPNKFGALAGWKTTQ